ncbi:MAG TPA: SDR family oxidoreductase [Blastocatellia bacterium]|nr:SDR family oxidoreductase [Blastocatellia bacterium]
MDMQAINVRDLFSIAGKVALVTGGSRGIGLMIARGYVEAGARVYISSRKKEACDRAAAELSEIGTCISIPADLSTAEGCARLAEELSSREQELHILVNNAGAAWGAPLEEYPEAGFDKVMDTNVKGIFFLTQCLLPLLEKGARDTDPARVINIGSIDGIKVPFIDNFAYSASKAAVHHLTRVLALKLGERGITVNAVAPGPFESQMTKWLLETYRERIESTCPLGRIGSPSDMAGVAIYLASRAGAYVNGAVIPVDGGISIT